jgi:signal peptidase II
MNALILFLITLGLDRFTKALALKNLFSGMRSPCAVLNLVLTWNPGISWSLFADSGEWGAWLLTLTICVVVALFSWHTLSRTIYFKSVWPEGLVLGGAVSNLIDRFLYGAVMDFIEFHAFGYSFPVFNVADIAIFIGVLGILLRKKPVERHGCGSRHV